MGCVTRVYTESAIFVIDESGVTVRSTHGITFEELDAKIPVDLIKA